MHSHIVNIDISHMGISLLCRYRLNLELHASEEKGVDNKLGHKEKGQKNIPIVFAYSII